MPESKKRVVKKEKEVKHVTYDPTKSKFGKIMILLLAVGMVLGIAVAAVYAVVQQFLS